MTEEYEGFVYIASPYSHKCKYEMHKRFQQVTDYAAECLKRGDIVYSPIAHNHHMQLSVGLPNTWLFWKRIDFAFLARAKELRVYCLPGWKESVGVTAEIEFANRLGIPVIYVYDHRTLIPSMGELPPDSRVSFTRKEME